MDDKTKENKTEKSGSDSADERKDETNSEYQLTVGMDCQYHLHLAKKKSDESTAEPAVEKEDAVQQPEPNPSQEEKSERDKADDETSASNKMDDSISNQLLELASSLDSKKSNNSTAKDGQKGKKRAKTLSTKASKKAKSMLTKQAVLAHQRKMMARIILNDFLSDLEDALDKEFARKNCDLELTSLNDFDEADWNQDLMVTARSWQVICDAMDGIPVFSPVMQRRPVLTGGAVNDINSTVNAFSFKAAADTMNNAVPNMSPVFSVYTDADSSSRKGFLSASRSPVAGSSSIASLINTLDQTMFEDFDDEASMVLGEPAPGPSRSYQSPNLTPFGQLMFSFLEPHDISSALPNQRSHQKPKGPLDQMKQIEAMHESQKIKGEDLGSIMTGINGIDRSDHRVLL